MRKELREYADKYKERFELWHVVSNAPVGWKVKSPWPSVLLTTVLTSSTQYSTGRVNKDIMCVPLS